MKRRQLHFIGAAFLDNYFWINSLEWNGYYRLDLELGEAEFLGAFDHADIFADKLFCQVLAYQKYIFYIPWFFDYLVRLDTRDLSTRYWKLPKSITKKEFKFRAANVYDGKIFMFPAFAESIYIFDIEKEDFECNNKFWVKEKEGHIVGKGDFIQGCQINDKVYLPNLSRNSFIEFDLTNYDFKTITFPENENAMMSVTRYGAEELLILSSRGNIWKYNRFNDERKLLYKYDGQLESPYSDLLVDEDSIYLIPDKEKNIKILQKEKEDILLYPSGWRKEHINVGIESEFFGCNKDKNILYTCQGNMLLEIRKGRNTVDGTVVYDDMKHIEYCKNEFRKYFILKREEQLPFVERKSIDLGIFVNTLESDGKNERKRIEIKNGSLIWKIVRDRK